MRTILCVYFVLTMCLLEMSAVRAEAADFSTIVGTVVKFDKDTLTIHTSDKPLKKVEVKVTGTSRFHLLSPQVRSGKTVITQRSAEAAEHLGFGNDWWQLATHGPAVPVVEEVEGAGGIDVPPKAAKVFLDGPGPTRF